MVCVTGSLENKDIGMRTSGSITLTLTVSLQKVFVSFCISSKYFTSQGGYGKNLYNIMLKENFMNKIIILHSGQTFDTMQTH